MAQDQNTLNKTKIDTGHAPIGTGAPVPSPGPEIFKDCPVELTEEGTWPKGFGQPKKPLPGKDPRLTKDARRNAFIEKIKPFLTGSTTERLQKAAEATVKCGIHFGSCGGTAGAIYAIAGVGDPKCLNTDGECRNHEKAKIVMGIPSGAPLRKFLCAHKEKCCTQYKDCSIDNSGCTTDKATAIQNVANSLKGKYKGYPDIWTDQLRPGDIIWVYNANEDCGGQHSAMFMGWGSGGWANVIQGEWGRLAYKGSICVKDSCGPKQQAITQIFRAP